jgi:hypothetical protein
LVTLPRRNNFRFVKKACLAANNDLRKTVKWQKQVVRNTKFDIIKRAQTTLERAAQNKKSRIVPTRLFGDWSEPTGFICLERRSFYLRATIPKRLFEAGVGLGAPNRPFVVHLVAW